MPRNKYIKVRLKCGRLVDKHRYIMEQHLGRRLDRSEVVHHIDGNSLNNDLSNLQLLSRSEHNKLHKHYENLDSGNANYFPDQVGENNSNAVLTDEMVRAIRIKFANSHKGIRAYARELGIDHSTIVRILQGKAWAHVKDIPG